MGHSVSYKNGVWNDMGEAISQVSAWSSGILDHMSAMDQTFRDLRDAVDHLDEDHRVSFSYKSIDGSLDRLRHDYQKLYTYTGDAGEAVSRHIDHPFYTKMDAFIQAMEQISIDKITTKNTINVKQYRPRTSIASVGGAKLLKKEITLDDLFSNNALMDASIKSEYECFKAMTTSKQAEKVTFDQYKEAIQYSRSFDYKSIRDKQIDKEFWVNLAAAGGIIILGIVCPPAGVAAGVAYGTMQMTDAVTGTSLISGRKLSTEERVTEGVFGVLDAIPGLKAAGAFGAIGRAGSKGVTKIGELSKSLGQSSSSRLMELKTVGRSSIKKVRTAAGERVAHVKQSAEAFADRLSQGGMQPAMAGGYGSNTGRVSARAEDTVQQIASKGHVRVQTVGQETDTKKMMSTEKAVAEIPDKIKKTVSSEVLLKQTSCSSADLYKYLKVIDPHFAEEYVKKGKWPDEIQIPKSSKVLKSNGKIDWSQVPNDGFTLDDLGNPNKKPYTKPKIGEVIDRYGSDDGRFTSPVIDGKPYLYEQRSLPYLEDMSKYHQYKIVGDFSNIKKYYENCSKIELKNEIDDYMTTWGLTFDDLTIQRGEIAHGFKSCGGGIQYQLPLPLNMLQDLSMIKSL